MPSQYNGNLTALAAAAPAAVNIASSTNTTPITITTSTPHGCTTGDRVVVDGHLVNTNANGNWECIRTSATTLQLVGSVGNGVGGASGTLRNSGFGVLIQLPSVGDPRDIGALAASLEAVIDRTAYLRFQLHYSQAIHAGGAVTYEADSTLTGQAGAGATWGGQWTFSSSSQVTFASSQVVYSGSTSITIQDTSHFVVSGLSAFGEFASSAKLHFITSSRIDFDDTSSLLMTGVGGVVTGTGDNWGFQSCGVLFNGSTSVAYVGTATADWGSGTKATFENNSTLKIVSGAHVDWTVVNGAITYDAATTINDGSAVNRTGATYYSGDGAYRGFRPAYFAPDSSLTLNAHKHDFMIMGSLSGNRTYTLADAPMLGVVASLYCPPGNFNGHTLTVKDQAGTTLATITAMVWALWQFNGTSWDPVGNAQVSF